MRIAWNILPSVGPRSGVGWYTAATLDALKASAGPEEHYLEFPGTAGQLLRKWWFVIRPWMIKPGKAKPILSTSGNTGSESGETWKSKVLGWARTRQESYLSGMLDRWHNLGLVDLYHEPNFLPVPTQVPTVTTFHDLSSLSHPEWHPVDRVRVFEKRAKGGLERSSHFFTLSNSVREEMVSVLGLKREQITITPMGVRPHLKPIEAQEQQSVLTRLGLPRGSFLHVGTLEPRKNLLMLAKTWCDLPAEHRSRHPLVLVGGWGWRCDDLREFLQTTGFSKGIRHLGYVDDADLPALYSSAHALLFPTKYEGFGMPPIEMMACGGAVIASTAPAVREVLDGQGHLVEIEDQDGWRSAMLKACLHPEWIGQLRTGATQWASRYTWSETARTTREGYARALGFPVPMKRAA
jgi:alpha-1,3-rhamnosyl/mannosyltransferase